VLDYITRIPFYELLHQYTTGMSCINKNDGDDDHGGVGVAVGVVEVVVVVAV
jgi:hypothetical protein